MSLGEYFFSGALSVLLEYIHAMNLYIYKMQCVAVKKVHAAQVQQACNFFCTLIL